MTPRHDRIEELLTRHIPSPSEAEMEADGARVLERLRDLSPISNGRGEHSRKSDPTGLVPRIVSKGGLLAIAASIVLVALFLPFVKSLLMPDKVYAIVEVVQGAVYQVTEGKAEAISAGQKIQASTPLRTASGAAAVLTLSDGARIEMHSGSELSLERADDGTNILLNDGSIRVTPAQKPTGNLYIQTVEQTVPVVSTLVLSAPAAQVIGPSSQVQSQAAEFEVASIREHVGGVSSMGDFRSSGRRAEYQNFSIQMLIAEAWNVRGDQIAVSPGVSPGQVYFMSARGRSAGLYEIAALAPEGMTPTRDEFRLLLQSLLATRFKLVTHTEKREKDVYVLQTNGTPKLKPSTGEGSCRRAGSFVPGGQKLVATHCPVQAMFENLFVGRPIYDQTGLTGFYDFEITAAPPYQANELGAITPAAAVRELGLRLDAQRIPVDTIVIDHVEPPSEN